MNKITTRQLIVFYFIYTYSIKFLMLPNLLAAEAGRDSWISALLGGIVELVLLFVVCKSMEHKPEIDVYQSLRKPFTHVGGAAILLVMFVLFLLQSFITIQQTYYLLGQTLYESMNIHQFLIPFLIVAIFFCFMPTRAAFRGGEIFYVLVLLGIGLALLPAFGKVNTNEVLPILGMGVGGIFNSVYKNLVYFESAIILFMFKGQTKADEGFTKKFMLASVVGVLVFAAFVFLYYSLFGPLTIFKDIAVVNITQVSSYISQNGRLDWIIACIWVILLLIRFGTTFFAAYACIKHITGISSYLGVISFPLAAGIYSLQVFAITSLAAFNSFLSNISLIVVIVYVAIPLLFLLSSFFRQPLAKRGGDV